MNCELGVGLVSMSKFHKHSKHYLPTGGPEVEVKCCWGRYKKIGLIAEERAPGSECGLAGAKYICVRYEE